MPQKLILPINKTRLTASFKADAYKNRFRLTHYGADMVSVLNNRTLYASGDGVVVGCGWDNVVGNVVAVLYLDATSRYSQTKDIVIRYYHLARINISKWQNVNKDSVLGQYGNAGQLSTGAHLHIEVDTDVGYPLYSPTVRNSNLIKGTAVGANDKTMLNPVDWLWCKASAPDNQSWTTANDAYILASDKSIPTVK